MFNKCFISNGTFWRLFRTFELIVDDLNRWFIWKPFQFDNNQENLVLLRFVDLIGYQHIKYLRYVLKKFQLYSNKTIEWKKIWSNDNIIKLIDLYKENTVLWNTKDKN